MKRYEQRSSPIASSDPCRQATIVGMYEVEPNDGSSYRHFYLASEVDARLSDLEKARARYEYVRRLNPHQFRELWERTMSGDGRFDALVDEAISLMER